MDYKDFTMVWNEPFGNTDLYDLDVGDYFIEDTYPDVYQIKEIVREDVLNGQIETVVKTWNITKNYPCRWFYSKAGAAYAPVLIKVKPIEK